MSEQDIQSTESTPEASTEGAETTSTQIVNVDELKQQYETQIRDLQSKLQSTTQETMKRKSTIREQDAKLADFEAKINDLTNSLNTFTSQAEEVEEVKATTQKQWNEKVDKINNEWTQKFNAAKTHAEQEIAAKSQLLKEYSDTIYNFRVKDAVISAANSCDAVNADTVYSILKDKISIDDENRVIVSDDNGNPVFINGELASVGAYVTEFLGSAANSYLVASKMATGSGSSETTPTPAVSSTGLPANFSTLPFDERLKILQSKGA